MQLSDIVLQGEAKYASHIAILFRDQSITYTALAEGVRTFAKTLCELGIKPGDRVGLLLPNCPQSVCAYYAVALMGGVVVPSNPLLKIGRAHV